MILFIWGMTLGMVIQFFTAVNHTSVKQEDVHTAARVAAANMILTVFIAILISVLSFLGK